MKELCIFFVVVFTVQTMLVLPQVSGTDTTFNCTGETYCAKLGGKCTADKWISNITECAPSVLTNAKSNPTCCSATQICVNGSCANDNVGNKCSNDTQCWAQAGLNLCVGGWCTIVGGAGDTCKNSPCYSEKFGDVTISLTCSSNGSRCIGIAEGGVCIDASSYINLCGSGLYCASGKCAKTTTGVCNVTECAPGYQCDGTNCLKVGSVAVGSSCGVAGLACVSDSVCAYGKCITSKTWKSKSCTNSSECTTVEANATCECYPESGKGYCTYSGYNLGANNQAISLVNCLVKNNCSYTLLDTLVFYDTLKYSCATENCNSESKKYIEAEYCDGATQGGSCHALTYCSGFPVWAIVVIVVVAVILVLSVVVVIFLVLQKKRQSYSSI